MSRASKQLTEARVGELVRIILDGAQSFDLTEYIREKERNPDSCWHAGEGKKPMSYSQIRRYASKAGVVIAKSVRINPKRKLRLHLAKRRNLYAKAVSQGDMRAALAILDSEAKLERLYDIVELDALEKKIAELREQVEGLKSDHNRLTSGNFRSTNGTGHSHAG